MKNLILIFISFILFGCPSGKQPSLPGSKGVPTFRDLFKNVSREERNLLEEACGADQNSANCRRAVTPGFVNESGVMGSPTLRRSEHCEDCRTHGAQAVRSDSADAWKPGCEVLEGVDGDKNTLKSNDKAKLNQCINSIKAAITTGAGKDRDKVFCNMYKVLRPEEQHFAGLVFTAVGEAGSLSVAKGTANPKYQESIFVMNSMDSRLRRAREKNGDLVNALDIALAPSQFSMYNASIFPKHGYEMLNPGSNAYNAKQDKALDAFIHFSNNENKKKIKPKPESDHASFYYSPTGMEKIDDLKKKKIKVNGVRRWETDAELAARKQRERDRVPALKAKGLIPQDHPAERLVPSWVNNELTILPNLEYDGIQIKQTLHKHVMYSRKDRKPYVGKIPNDWRINRTKSNGQKTCK